MKTPKVLRCDIKLFEKEKITGRRSFQANICSDQLNLQNTNDK